MASLKVLLLMHIICLVTLEFLHSLDCGVGVGVDVVDGVEVKGG